MKTYNEIIAENRAWAEQTFSKVDKKLSAVTLRSRDKLVDGVGPDGKTHKSTRPEFWTSGFWGGMNVLMYEHTKNEEYLKTAKRSEELLDVALSNFEGLYHDVGFMWHILSGALYRLTGDEKSKVRNLYAAASLQSRYVMDANFIRAWNGNVHTEKSIIDCMMNLPLLYFASDVIGDDRFKQIAVAHADMTLKEHIRPDGSVIHVVSHDRDTFECTEKGFGQGYAIGSSWSRGQAWAVYGFVISYNHTGDIKYLDAAKKVAHYFISNVCDDWMAKIDFRAPNEPVYFDNAASMIAAAGLLEIAKQVPEYEGGIYANAAINILKAVSSRFADYNPDTDVMLGHSSMCYPIPGLFTVETASVEVPIIYTEYYFVEALLKILGSEFNPW